jgi:REP element-mobilizing transposase RayT
MDTPVRKDIRLDNYDYSRNGAYFVTICTKNKMCIFWDNNDKYKPIPPEHTAKNESPPKNALPTVGAHSVRPPDTRNDTKIHLSEFGLALKKSIQTVSRYYSMIHFDKYVIMPNHIHAIIRIQANNAVEEIGGRTECAPTLSQIIKNFKENVTREIGFSVWQKSFYDRILRNEFEYRGAWQYIENNPANWENDELFSKE